MSLTRWFRRHQKHFLAVLVVLLMGSFGLGGTLSSLARGGGGRVGTINGEGVQYEDMVGPDRAVRLLSAMGSLFQRGPVMLAGLPEIVQQYLMFAAYNPNLRDAAAYLSGSEGARTVRGISVVADFLFQQPADGDKGTGAVWRMTVLDQEAQRAGVEVYDSDVAVLERLLVYGGQLGVVNPYARDLLARETGQAAADDGLITLMRVLKLVALRQEAVPTSIAEAYAAWLRMNAKARVDYVALPAKAFVPFVVPAATGLPDTHSQYTEEDVAAFFADHRSTRGDAESGTIGYKLPVRVRVRYATARMDEVTAEAEAAVSDEDVRKYYEDPVNKGQFEERIEEPSDEDDEAGPDEENEAKDEPTEAEPEAGDAAGATEKAGDPGDAPAAEDAADGAGGGGEDGADDAEGGPGDADEDAADDDAAAADEAGEEDAAPEDDPLAPREGYRRKTFDEVKGEIRERLVKAKTRELASERIDRSVSAYKATEEGFPGEVAPLDEAVRAGGLDRPRIAGLAGRELLSMAELANALPGDGGAVQFAFDEGRAHGSVGSFKNMQTPFILQLLEREPEKEQELADVRDQVVRDLKRVRAVELAMKEGKKLAELGGTGGLDEALKGLSRRLGLSDEAELKVSESEYFVRKDRQIKDVADSGPMLRKAFTLADGEYGVVATTGKDPLCYVFTTRGRQAPDDKDFAEEGPAFRYAYLSQKQRGALWQWMDELLAASKYEPPETEQSS